MTKKQFLEELKWQKTNYKRPQRTNLKRSSKDEKQSLQELKWQKSNL